VSALPNCVRCIDKSANPDPPCMFVTDPSAVGVLSVVDMIRLGYCGCAPISNPLSRNRLANADRFKSCGYTPKEAR
jgi:hypothetical protein